MVYQPIFVKVSIQQIQKLKVYIYFMKMIEQFHKVLRTPKPSTAHTLGKTQDLILCTFQQIFPQTFDLQFLHNIYEEVLGPDAFPGSGQIQITIQEQISLNYRLVQYFITLIKTNFVNIEVYKSLQDQTQKAESTIRSHIKIQQQMKMYLQYLQSKLDKMHKLVYNVNESPQHLKRQLQIMENRISLLQKQKINLMKKNEKFQRQIESLNNKIQSLISPKDSASKSIQSRKYIGQNNNVTQKYQDIRHSDMNFTQVKQANKLSARSAYDRQSYRNSAHDYDLTQKKKSMHFPSNY